MGMSMSHRYYCIISPLACLMSNTRPHFSLLIPLQETNYIRHTEVSGSTITLFVFVFKL